MLSRDEEQRQSAVVEFQRVHLQSRVTEAAAFCEGEDPYDPNRRARVAEALLALADFEQECGNTDRAEKCLNDAVQACREGLNRDPSAEACLRGLATACHNLGLIFGSREQWEQAEAHSGLSVETLEQLYALRPDDCDIGLQLCDSLGNRAIGKIELGRPQDAQPILDRFQVIASVCVQNHPERPELRQALDKAQAMARLFEEDFGATVATRTVPRVVRWTGMVCGVVASVVTIIGVLLMWMFLKFGIHQGAHELLREQGTVPAESDAQMIVDRLTSGMRIIDEVGSGCKLIFDGHNLPSRAVRLEKTFPGAGENAVSGIRLMPFHVNRITVQREGLTVSNDVQLELRTRRVLDVLVRKDGSIMVRDVTDNPTRQLPKTDRVDVAKPFGVQHEAEDPK